MKQSAYQFWLASSIAFCYLTTTCPTLAQIVPDATLPHNSIVIREGNISRIEGGTQTGSNLFHSFEQFNVPAGGTAFFNNAAQIQNIFSRVTGSYISNIDGLIKANGNANLFLINPKGIIFGTNASLNIGGSFLASTANSFVFKDGTQFSATNPQAPPLLTVKVPIGLQFQGTSGQITIIGSGHNLDLEIKLKGGDREAIIRDARPDGLKVQPGNTLALVGGNVILDGGNLTGNGGRIELWSVVNGQVSVDSINQRLTINNEQGTATYGTIQLIDASSLDASGNNGEIQVQAQKLSLQDGSTMFAITQGTEQGSTLTIKASESVELLGATPTGEGELFRSSLLSQNFAQGNGSNITIETGKLTVNGGQAGTFAFREGNAGNLTIRATKLIDVADIFGESDTQFVGGLFSQVKPEATGNGGELRIETRQFNIQGGAEVSTTTSGAGAAGNLTVNASESVQLIDSRLTSQSERGTTGASGALTIITGKLLVLDGAEISASTGGAGNAGDLLIRASDSVELRGNNDFYPSGIFAQVTKEEATGNGGNLTVETRRLILQDGGEISVITFGKGQAGNLIVRGIGGKNTPTDSVELSGISFDGEYPSALLATTEADGNGGNLDIYTRNLILTDGAQVAASTFSTGSGGSVTVNALDSVQLIGTNGKFASGLFARTREDSSGDAGSLTVTTESLTIQNGATLTVSSFLGSGTAAAGNLTVSSDNILMDNGIINADTASGDFGNIELTSNNIQLRRESRITTNTNSSTGGNITINTDTIAALENSDITANAARGFGGRVTVNTQGIFGTAYREKVSEITSDITATSELGPQFNGVVEINTPDVDPTQGLIQLPNPEPPRQIARGCPADEGSFIVTGSGGLPANPSEALRSNAVVVNWVTLPPREENRSVSMTFTTPKFTRIVEAQGWIINANGEVILTEQPTTVTPYNSGGNMASCHRSG